ncbi:GNAT family N-acetyltransferase [Kitasatospora sp. MAP5-34]|uniref:GNAT family N-acetyltransferase n=1 Tax=Kitasatospora sp. MAP5-34 TaxID=3035102 RepID=UPI00247695A9|nr:GNAT family N-acetyltransferase [Kitasatospora sp. MAP5-34]MDH6575867.1 GNAT superfamily N-acetyltransferase [Kitasatospora sp. MAP5-34]
MTTTLRPEYPEAPFPGGGRSRRWQICVNGRPVGGLRTTAFPRGSQSWGEISELGVTAGRRRGRATVGVLAAEEVLRSWGCSRVDVNIPAEATAALGLAEALGYTERMRNLAKHLTQPPELPAELTVRPIGAEEYPEWLEAAQQAYLRDLLASGLSEPQARAKAEADHRQQLPQGPGTRGVALRALYGPRGTPLGSLWVNLHQDIRPSGERLAWVMTVEVEPAQRGHGYGRALMLLAERECLAAGVRELGLNVFSGNAVAIGLYDSLGYRVTNRILGKSLL